jgi:hypothetical protein
MTAYGMANGARVQLLSVCLSKYPPFCAVPFATFSVLSARPSYWRSDRGRMIGQLESCRGTAVLCFPIVVCLVYEVAAAVQVLKDHRRRHEAGATYC